MPTFRLATLAIDITQCRRARANDTDEDDARGDKTVTARNEAAVGGAVITPR